MREIALATGGNFDQLMGSAEQLSERIGEAFIQKSGAAYDALNAMGLKAGELAVMPLDEQMLTIATRMNEMNLSVNEATFLLAELGISGKEVVAIMMQYVEANAAAEEATRAFGLALTDLESDGISRANKSFGVFRQWLEGLTNDFNVAASPAITTFNETIGELLMTLPDARGAFELVAGGVVILAGSLISVGEAVKGLGQTLIGAVQMVSGGVNTIVGAAGEAIKATINLAIDGINTLLKGWNMVADVVPGLGTANMIDPFSGGNTVLSTGLADLAAGAEKIGAGLTNIGEGLSNSGAGGQFIQDYFNNKAAMQGGTYTRPESDSSGSGSLGQYGPASGGGGGESPEEKATKELEKQARAIEKLNRENEKRYKEELEFWEEAHPYQVEYMDYMEEMKAGAEMLGSVWQNAYQGMEDALVSFVTTGKLSFKDMINSMIEDIARYTIRMAMFGGQGGGGIMGALGGMLGMGGGMPTSPVPLPVPAMNFNGGVVNRPTRFLSNGGLTSMSEKGAEAILPLSRDGQGRLGVVGLGGGGAGGNVININTTINAQTSGDPNEDGEKMARQFNVIVENKIVQVMSKMQNQRQGGMYRGR